MKNFIQGSWLERCSRRLLVGLLAVVSSLALAAPAAVPVQNSIDRLNVSQQGDEVVFKVTLKDPITAVPPSFAVSQPARIVLDFGNTSNGLGRASQVFNEGDLRSVNVVQGADRTRLVINLTRSMAYKQSLEGNELLVVLSPVAVPSTAQDNSVVHFTEAPAVRKAEQSLRDVNFRRGKDGEARIVVDLSDPDTGIDIRQQGGVLLVDFLKTSVPDALRRKMDVNDFATPVSSLTVAQQGENGRITISPKGLWEHNAYQTDGQFIIEVKPIVENPNKLVQGSKLGFQGPKVSISYQNGDVRQLLRVMAEELGLNAVISESVSGTTTLVLKDVPADQVMDIIFSQKGLDMRKNGNVVLIAPREELATREKLELESRAQLSDLEPLLTEAFQLNYQRAEAVQKLISDSSQKVLSKRGSAVVDARTNNLFVLDTATKLDEIRKLIAKIDIPVRQVLIEARIVEAQDTFSKSLGARLGVSDFQGTSTGHTLGGSNVRYGIGGNLNSVAYMSGQSATQSSLTDATSINLPASAVGGSSAGAISFTLFNSSKTQFLNLELSALESDGKGKVVSSPRVVTADQVEASIEQGTEIPYQQATSSGATSVSFKKASLVLKVKPQITPEGKVIMALEINKDTPNTSLSTGSGIAIDTKKVKTEVLVDNGGTVVIGGIYTQTLTETINRIPVLGELPYVGNLFRKSDKTDNRSELLVFITPRVVADSLTLR